MVAPLLRRCSRAWVARGVHGSDRPLGIMEPPRDITQIHARNASVLAALELEGWDARIHGAQLRLSQVLGESWRAVPGRAPRAAVVAPHPSLVLYFVH